MIANRETVGGPKQALNRIVTEALLANFDIYQFSREQVESIRVSPDNRHITYISLVGSGFRVAVDQQYGNRYAGIHEEPLFLIHLISSIILPMVKRIRTIGIWSLKHFNAVMV